MNKDVLKGAAIALVVIFAANQFSGTRGLVTKFTGAGNRFFR